ncbi:MAG: ZIP family metal transporter [Nitrospinota bacterium]
MSYLVLYGILGSLLAGLATGAGALPILLNIRVTERLLDTLLGGAAGVMLAATSFSLIVPGIEAGTRVAGGFWGVWLVILGILAGALFLHKADTLIPHEHFQSGPEGPSRTLRKTWLFVLAITIHNFPEGLAVGVGFGSGDTAAAIALAFGIGLQNMPEGLAVAIALMREGYSKGRALWIATASGLVEPIAGALGASVVVIAMTFLPFAMGFAAGAMLFVISDEIIPETHSRGNHLHATYGVMFGFVIMTSMDNLLG